MKGGFSRGSRVPHTYSEKNYGFYPLNGKNILNFHFDYLHPSLNRDKKMFKRAMEKLVRKDANTQKTLLG